MAIGVSAVALAACAVSSDVARFHRLTPEYRNASFVIVPAREQVGSAPFAHYAQRVAGHIIRHGFLPAPEGAVARLRVEFALHAGAAVATTRREPIYVRTYDPWYGVYPGAGVYHRHFGTGLSWSIAGYETVTTTRYPRIFELRIFDRWAPPERAGVFEGRAVNHGPDPSPAGVGDCLIDALFHDFPGTSGNQRAIAVSPAQCR
jgi:hypothetical protein